MKGSFMTQTKRGVCHVCGKSTQLLIHRPCSESIAPKPKARKVRKMPIESSGAMRKITGGG